MFSPVVQLLSLLSLLLLVLESLLLHVYLTLLLCVSCPFPHDFFLLTFPVFI